MLSLAAVSLAAPTRRSSHTLAAHTTATDVAQIAYWQQREAHNELYHKFDPIIKSKSTSLYSPASYGSGKCMSWCSGDVKIDRVNAEARGRVSFPPNDLADWVEKCSWDELCSGCGECASVNTCEAWCSNVQGKTFPDLCNWGPCHGCSECAAPITASIASLATMCTYTASNLPPAVGDLATACEQTKSAGWALAEKFSVVHPASGGVNDTDNAFFWRSGDDCLLSIHGMDRSEFYNYQFVYSAQSKPFHGVSAGLSQGLIDELDVFLDHISDKYGSLAAWTATCPGDLYLAGHSMGAGIAAVLGYMANLKSDPLGLKKPVTELYLFAAMPPATTELTNEQSADGCFAGSNYYTRTLDGVVPGFSVIADGTFLTGGIDVPSLGFVNHGMVPAKTSFTSMDLTGTVRDASNLLGPGVLTPCGSLPEAYATMKNTTYFEKMFAYFIIGLDPTNPANIGYHDAVAYLRPADAAANTKTGNSMTASIASLATMCTYTASNLVHALFGDLTTACEQTKSAGWALAEKFSVVHPASGGVNDTDNAFFWRSGDDCLLSIHGMDRSEFYNYQFVYSAQSKPFHGVSAGLSQGLIDELDVFLDHISDKYGSLAAWTATCPGDLYLAGHSMGAGIAAVLGYMANLKSDPLGLKKPVTELYLFAAMPPATTELTNEQSADGCFAGSNYYTRTPAGVVPGYPALGDPCFAVVNAFGLTSEAMLPAKTSWTSLDLTGPVSDASNLVGPAVFTPCGSLPEIYTTMKNISNFQMAYSYYALSLNTADPANIGYHEPFSYMWPIDH